MILALARPQTASDRLDKPDARLCWPCVADATNVKINACIERGDIADNPGFAGSKPIEDFLALEQLDVAVNILGADSGLDEPLL